MWILIGVVAGSLVVSSHDNKEACEGRAVTLREAKVAAKCVEAPGISSTFRTYQGAITLCGNGTCQ